MSKSTIIEAMASTLWASAWADHVDTHECCNLSGCNIEDHMPPIPQDARDLAHVLVGKLEQANGMCLLALYARAMTAQGITFPEPATGEIGREDWVYDAKVEQYDSQCDMFGSDLAMEAMGTGVAWSDDHAEFEHTTPHIDTYDLLEYADENCTNDVADTHTHALQTRSGKGRKWVTQETAASAEALAWAFKQHKTAGPTRVIELATGKAVVVSGGPL